MGIRERKERERNRRRQQILVAARLILAAKGYSKTSIEEIAAATELSPSTICNYFRNKKELFASLTLHILCDLLFKIENINNASDLSAEERLDRLKQAIVNTYELDPLSLINLLHLQAGERLKASSTELEDDIRSLFNQVLAAMAKIFQEGIRKGLLLDRHPLTLAATFWALFSGTVLSRTGGQSVGDAVGVHQAFDISFQILRRGIAVAV